MGHDTIYNIVCRVKIEIGEMLQTALVLPFFSFFLYLVVFFFSVLHFHGWTLSTFMISSRYICANIYFMMNLIKDDAYCYNNIGFSV